MKLRQREWCHNCQQHVIFEFEDINVRQVIICPSCGHEHYRELDDATILDIQFDQMHGTGQFRVAKMPEMLDIAAYNDVPTCSIPLETKTYNVVGQDADGRPILDGDPIADGYCEGRKIKRVSERRWGVDPRQRA